MNLNPFQSKHWNVGIRISIKMKKEIRMKLKKLSFFSFLRKIQQVNLKDNFMGLAARALFLGKISDITEY